MSTPEFIDHELDHRRTFVTALSSAALVGTTAVAMKGWVPAILIGTIGLIPPISGDLEGANGDCIGVGVVACQPATPQLADGPERNHAPVRPLNVTATVSSTVSSTTSSSVAPVKWIVK